MTLNWSTLMIIWQRIDEMRNSIVNKGFIIICFINFFMSLGQQISNVLIPKYVDFLGGSPFIVGFATSIFALSSFVTKPISGPSVDSFDRRKILLISSVVTALTLIGFSISRDIYMVILVRLLQGICAAFMVITCLTLVADTVDNSVLTSAISYYFITTAVAQAIGPQVGLLLQDYFGYANAFLSGMIFILISIVLIMMMEKKEISPKKLVISFDNAFAKEALVPAVIMLFLAIVYVNIASFLVLYAESVNISSAGLFFSVNAGTLLFTRPLVGRLADRYGIVRILPYAIVCFGISMVLISYSSSLSVLLIAAFINGFGYGACQPLIQSLCMKSVPSDRRGAASATSYYGTDIGYLIGPLIAGTIVEKFSYAMMFRVMPLFLLISLGVIWIKRDYIHSIDSKN